MREWTRTGISKGKVKGKRREKEKGKGAWLEWQCSVSNIERIVVDTNVFVGACLGAGASNEVVALCLGAEVVGLL